MCLKTRDNFHYPSAQETNTSNIQITLAVTTALNPTSSATETRASKSFQGGGIPIVLLLKHVQELNPETSWQGLTHLSQNTMATITNND